VKKYEGLFILNTAGKEEGVKEMVDRITADINAAGGRVETVQKMDKRPFSRVANKRFNSGYFVNLVFDIEPSALTQLRHRFSLNDEVFRVLFTIAPAPKPVPAAA
jgi:ribosomal protein S6